MGRDVEGRLRTIAGAQRGLLRRPDALRAGLSETALQRRVTSQRLVTIYPGIWALGHTALTREGWWLAAVWSCGPSAALSHFSAAALHGMAKERGTEIHVTTLGAARTMPGRRVHRTRHLDPVDVVVRRGIRATARARTLLDLADVVGYRELRTLVDDLRQLDVAELRAAQGRAPGRRGAGRIARLLARDEPRSRSAFERRYLRWVAVQRLPRPDGLNVPQTVGVVDCRYDAARLVVELDGRAWHERRGQMATDRRRDAELQLAGWRVLRLVWEDLDAEWAAETRGRLARFLGV